MNENQASSDLIPQIQYTIDLLAVIILHMKFVLTFAKTNTNRTNQASKLRMERNYLKQRQIFLQATGVYVLHVGPKD